jgi:hydroxypyruvate reductase
MVLIADNIMDERLPDRYRDAIAIFQAGLAAVAPGAAISRFCRLEGDLFFVDGVEYDLRQYRKIFILGAGKAGAAMAKSVETMLEDRITEGIITVKDDHLEELKRITIRQASHPVPDARGLAAAREIYSMARRADKETLVICLLSGGGSALLPLPVNGVSLEDKQETTRVLLSCGATIHEINSVRKHLSVIKGGGLARAVYPATLVTLILSDVVGDDLDAIASGPCVPDPTTFVDCMTIFTKYGIEKKIPVSVYDHIRAGLAGKVTETPKKDQEFFAKNKNIIIGRNFDALTRAKEEAEALGYKTLLLSSSIEGETREVAACHMAVAREIGLSGNPVRKPACLLSGGETTVTIRGVGKGGRNQEFVLAAVLRMGGLRKIVVLSAGTDGTDGPTDAAGAVADETTLERAAERGLDPQQYLDKNDSYHFFAGLGNLYKTGPTNTNVMDLRIILVES